MLRSRAMLAQGVKAAVTAAAAVEATPVVAVATAAVAEGTGDIDLLSWRLMSDEWRVLVL